MASAYLTVPHLSTKELTRIFSKIAIDPSVQWEGAPCWNWAGSKTDAGYGHVRWKYIARGQAETHRLMYAWLVHPLPPNRDQGTVDHLCRNTSCCNPAHLEFVPERVNTLRNTGPSALNAAKTHCIHGHEFTPENTRLTKRGARRCMICRRASSKKYREMHPAEMAAAIRAWRTAHKDKENERQRQRYAENAEARRAYNRTWKAKRRIKSGDKHD